jgi:hypothetical protein
MKKKLLLLLSMAATTALLPVDSAANPAGVVPLDPPSGPNCTYCAPFCAGYCVGVGAPLRSAQVCLDGGGDTYCYCVCGNGPAPIIGPGCVGC